MEQVINLSIEFENLLFLIGGILFAIVLFRIFRPGMRQYRDDYGRHRGGRGGYDRRRGGGMGMFLIGLVITFGGGYLLVSGYTGEVENPKITSQTSKGIIKAGRKRTAEDTYIYQGDNNHPVISQEGQDQLLRELQETTPLRNVNLGENNNDIISISHQVENQAAANRNNEQMEEEAPAIYLVQLASVGTLAAAKKALSNYPESYQSYLYIGKEMALGASPTYKVLHGAYTSEGSAREFSPKYQYIRNIAQENLILVDF